MSSRSRPRRGHDLIELIRSNTWMMQILRAVRDEQIPDAWIGAGVLRDLVWGERYGAGFSPGEVRDVDVAFFDPHDLSRANDDRVTQRLLSRLPDVLWEAKNQAAVHTWYPARFGGAAVEPLTSIHDAVGTWPETATAVAVRLGVDDVIEVCAPWDVDDLLDGVWRRNPRRVDVQRSVARLTRHQPATRWPGVSVVPPETGTAPAAFPGRTLAMLVALVAALAVAFVFAPPSPAGNGDLADRGRLGAAFRAAMVGYRSSVNRDYRAGSTERRARRVWAWFGVGSALSSLIMVVVLVANVGTARNPAPALLGLFNVGF